jgi:hypothetical protein
MTESPTETPTRHRRNWWKVGFFVMLLAFETAREISVVESDQKAIPNVTKSIYGNLELITAQGRWMRSDGGSPIINSAVTIYCRSDWNQCFEANVLTYGQYFFAPEIDWFDAEFTADGVTYFNDQPKCVTYAVRIDLKQSRAFATRVAKTDGQKNQLCPEREPRAEMELGGGYTPDADPFKDHFVPIIRLLSKVMS